LAKREVLNKNLSVHKETKPLQNPVPAPISLDILKKGRKEDIRKDRAATPENMDKLKNLIATTSTTLPKAVVAEKEKIFDEKKLPEPIIKVEETKKEPVPVPDLSSIKTNDISQAPIPTPAVSPQSNKPTTESSVNTITKEVPEDILRKVLE